MMWVASCMRQRVVSLVLFISETNAGLRHASYDDIHLGSPPLYQHMNLYPSPASYDRACEMVCSY